MKIYHVERNHDLPLTKQIEELEKKHSNFKYLHTYMNGIHFMADTKFDQFLSELHACKTEDELEKVTNELRESEELTDQEKEMLDAESYCIYDGMQATSYRESW